MNIEQIKPNKPNFGVVVALASVSLLVIIVVAYFMLHWGGRDFLPHHTSAHPTSQLTMPGYGRAMSRSTGA